MAAKSAQKPVRVRQVRSAIGSSPKQAAALRSLGLGRIGSSTERTINPNIAGQIRIVTHLVETEEIS